jgi:NADPH:quinone reductase-like Zn-dependent oxidoreductase
MKALIVKDYGGPDNLVIAEHPDPVPGPEDVLVRPLMTGLNPIDWKMRQGELRAIFPAEPPFVIGREFSGEIIAAGDDVSDFTPGDKVFGAAQQMRDGAHAELLATKAETVAHQPDNLPDEVAAVLPAACLSAYIPLVDVAALKAGQRVLIHAGAGGVGSYAIALAKHLGAEVVATCGPASIDYVTSRGADRVVDYAREDFADTVRDCDVVLDLRGGETHIRSYACLKPGGVLTYLTAAPIPKGPPPRDDVRAEFKPIIQSKHHLGALAELALTHGVLPDITEVFPFNAAREALAQIEAGHQRGKLVLTMEK